MRHRVHFKRFLYEPIRSVHELFTANNAGVVDQNCHITNFFLDQIRNAIDVLSSAAVTNIRKRFWTGRLYLIHCCFVRFFVDINANDSRTKFGPFSEQANGQDRYRLPSQKTTSLVTSLRLGGTKKRNIACIICHITSPMTDRVSSIRFNIFLNFLFAQPHTDFFLPRNNVLSMFYFIGFLRRTLQTFDWLLARWHQIWC